MIPSRPSGVQLQRRTGRRQSTPTSPTSPTFQRRFGRSQDAFWPTEPRSATTAAESPTVDIPLPSSAIDFPFTSRPFDAERTDQNDLQPINRASDDLGKIRPRFLAETIRPATSGSGIGKVQIPYGSTNSPENTEVKNSLAAGSGRTSTDTPRRSSSRETRDDGFTSSLRAGFASSQQQDRVFLEDTSTMKSATYKKSRFNLLNPKNLLARRRSSQNADRLEEMNLNVTGLHVPAMPDHVKPTIRGKFVHDFSTPKNRRVNNESSPLAPSISSPSYPRRPSDIASPALSQAAATPTLPHSPMFREHFQEDQRSVQPSNTAYLHGQNLQLPTQDSLPSFAKRLPLNIPDENQGDMTPTDDFVRRSVKPRQQDQLPPVPEIPPPPPPERVPSPVQEFNPSGTLPRHMASTSSRFSFQIGQQGSLAQEKYLEERHKEHAAKQPADIRLSVTSMDDMDDYDNFYDGMDDDGGFDNGEITVKNVELPSSHVNQFSGPVEEDYGYDDEEGDEFGTGDIEVKNIDIPTNQMNKQDVGNRIHRRSLQAFHFTPQSLSFSPSTAQHTSESTPRDFDGLPIGLAEFKDGGAYSIHPQIRDSVDASAAPTFFEGLGISTATQFESGGSTSGIGGQPFEDSELYFDDGEFIDHLTNPVHKFDEEALDDATKIRDIPAENARKYEEAVQRSLPGEKIKIVSAEVISEPGAAVSQSLEALTLKTPAENHEFNLEEQPCLTEGNLAAYHDALALEINQAAADGKFDRNVSFSQMSDDGTDSSFHNSIHGISSRGSHYSNNIMNSALSEEDSYGFGEDMDDDEMIAAANAEALENDDEGLYGQEFGFYARAHSKDAAQFSNGGYFTSRGSNGVKRSHSGKNNFQEPSLTPITERSEWSARNSVYSLPIPPVIPGAGQPQSSPGIAELISMDSPIVEDEMSLKTLMKLRRGFGGSSTSVNSAGDRHHSHSSPLALLGEYLPTHADTMGRRMSSPTPGISGFMIAESEDEDDNHDRPTVTQNTPQKTKAQPMSQSFLDQPLSSPLGRKGNHSRNSSGAESISYAQDTDGRWVMEKRRKGDDGELDIVEREYLVGARI